MATIEVDVDLDDLDNGDMIDHITSEYESNRIDNSDLAPIIEVYEFTPKDIFGWFENPHISAFDKLEAAGKISAWINKNKGIQ